MSMKPLLDHYAAFDRWANRRFVERLAGEPDAVLDAIVPSSFPSLRATILHIRNAENTWYGRLAGISTAWPAEEGTRIESLLPYTDRLVLFVNGLDEAGAQRVVDYLDLRGRPHRQPVWQMLMHCFNHGTYHRGQLVTMMRVLTMEHVPATDLVVFQRTTDGDP